LTEEKWKSLIDEFALQAQLYAPKNSAIKRLERGAVAVAIIKKNFIISAKLIITFVNSYSISALAHHNLSFSCGLLWG
jgi:hypothetical protein